MLSANAFNALLKTLEEPPPHVVFILATTEPHKILPTVLSRCQHYPLRRISQAEITGQLQRIISVENVSVSDDGLAIVAIAADGSLRDAQSLLDKLIAFGGDQVDDETVVSLLGMVDRSFCSAPPSLSLNRISLESSNSSIRWWSKAPTCISLPSTFLVTLELYLW
jgi:DNA polymerase-3 subunit gamma/tau